MTRYEVIIYWSDQDQAFIAEAPELAGCAADGPTHREALAALEVVIEEGWDSLECVASRKELATWNPEGASFPIFPTPRRTLQREFGAAQRLDEPFGRVRYTIGHLARHSFEKFRRPRAIVANVDGIDGTNRFGQMTETRRVDLQKHFARRGVPTALGACRDSLHVDTEFAQRDIDHLDSEALLLRCASLLKGDLTPQCGFQRKTLARGYVIIYETPQIPGSRAHGFPSGYRHTNHCSGLPHDRRR